MSEVNYRSDHDGSTFCPALSAALGKLTQCAEDSCEWWVHPRDDEFACCAVNKCAHDLSTISYHVSR